MKAEASSGEKPLQSFSAIINLPHMRIKNKKRNWKNGGGVIFCRLKFFRDFLRMQHLSELENNDLSI